MIGGKSVNVVFLFTDFFFYRTSDRATSCIDITSATMSTEPTQRRSSLENDVSNCCTCALSYCFRATGYHYLVGM